MDKYWLENIIGRGHLIAPFMDGRM